MKECGRREAGRVKERGGGKRENEEEWIMTSSKAERILKVRERILSKKEIY